MRRTSRDFMRSAKWPARDCTARTGWRAIRFWRHWSALIVRRKKSFLATRHLSTLANSTVAVRQCDQCGRTRSRLAQLGRNPALDVGLRRHCAHEQAAAARTKANREFARGDSRLLLEFHRDKRFIGTAQYRDGRGIDRAAARCSVPKAAD